MKFIISVIFLGIILSCNGENDIDKHNVDIESLKSLPNNTYGYHRGVLFIGNNNFTIWFNRDSSGLKIDNIKKIQSENNDPIKNYQIDTIEYKELAQKFIDISIKKYKFGHLRIDRNSEISVSYKIGKSNQYVKPLNDSVNNFYENSSYYKRLKNGWFEKSN